jgi:hypothetical protein
VIVTCGSRLPRLAFLSGFEYDLLSILFLLSTAMIRLSSQGTHTLTTSVEDKPLTVDIAYLGIDLVRYVADHLLLLRILGSYKISHTKSII